MDIALNGQSKLTVTGEAAYVTFPAWNVPGYVHYGYSSRMLGDSKGIYALKDITVTGGELICTSGNAGFNSMGINTKGRMFSTRPNNT